VPIYLVGNHVSKAGECLLALGLLSLLVMFKTIKEHLKT